MSAFDTRLPGSADSEISADRSLTPTSTPSWLNKEDVAQHQSARPGARLAGTVHAAQRLLVNLIAALARFRLFATAGTPPSPARSRLRRRIPVAAPGCRGAPAS